MLNRWEGIGNLGRDPEIRHAKDGRKIATISLGVTKKWKDRNGERQERTEWVRCVAFSRGQGDGLAGVIGQYTRKGSKIYVAGEMTTRKWQDQSGADRYSTEIILDQLVLLDGRESDQGDAHRPSGNDAGPDLDGDEIPW